MQQEVSCIIVRLRWIGLQSREIGFAYGRFCVSSFSLAVSSMFSR